MEEKFETGTVLVYNCFSKKQTRIEMINTLRQPKGFYRNVFALMVPMVLQNLISQTVALSDTLMVGMLGEQYLAAATLATTPLFLFMIFTFGVQSGAGVLVAQYWGKGNTNAINRVLGVGLYFSVLFTLAGAVAIAAIPHQILGLVTNDGLLVELGAPYVRIAGFSMVLNAAGMIYVSCQRSMENARLGVIVLMISSVINVFGNWMLIFGNLGMPALGLQGAAVSTLCARAIEVIIISVYALRNSRLPLKIKLLFTPGVVIFKDFIKYSLPVLFNEALWGFGAMLFPVILGHMAGAQTILAGYNIAGNIERLFSVAIFASGGATAVIIGREIGAGRRDRVDSVAKSLIGLGWLLGLSSGALILIARFTILEPFIYPLFDLSSEAAATATIILTIMAIAAPFRTQGFTMGVGVLRGGGDVKAFMIIDVATLYVVYLPIAAIGGLVLKAGIAVVYSGMLIESVVKATWMYLRIRSGKWIHDVTRDIT